MTIKKSGKCCICQAVYVQTKDFTSSVDMFNPTAKLELKGELADQVLAWRDEPGYCELHANS